MGCNTPQAAEENFPTVPTEYTKLHLHRAVIHAPFPKAPRTQSLSLRLPRRSKGKSEGSQAGGHRAESSPEPGTRTLPITGSDTALLCRGAPPPWVHAADRETAMHGMHESPVVPTGGFLFSLRLYKIRFLLVASRREQRSGAELSHGCREHRPQPGLLPASFARRRHIARPPRHAFHPLTQKLNDFEQVVFNPSRCLIDENVKICADEATINGRFNERLKQPFPERARACVCVWPCSS